MKDIYLISGLGADERLFRRLELDGYTLHQVKWIAPLTGESWESYARRLSAAITTPAPVIIGMSMGGMMAVEIAKQMPVGKVILISSAKTKQEIPPYFKWLRVIKVHRWLPYGLLRFVGKLTGPWLFGTRNPEESRLLKEIIEDIDETFFRWAWDRVSRWQNQIIPANTVHIHGNRDRMLPLRYVKADRLIGGGTHFMVVHDAKEISRIIKEELRSNI